MKRGIRLLFGMGILILLVSVWNLATIDWNAIEKISELLGWQIFWSNLVFCSVGITEMAVAYLLDARARAWPLGRENPPEDRISHTIEKKDGTMTVIQNLRTYGEPQLVDDVYLYPNMPPSLWEPDWEDYPHGGIRLTVTPEGEDPYTLIGSFEKTMLYIAYNPKAGILENSRWNFTITAVEDGDAPDDAVGSTMYGTIKSWQGGSPMEIKSTKGTRIFEGAFLRGTHTTSVGPVFEIFPPPGPPVYVLFTWSEGSGEIVFP